MIDIYDNLEENLESVVLATLPCMRCKESVHAVFSTRYCCFLCEDVALFFFFFAVFLPPLLFVLKHLDLESVAGLTCSN